MNQREFVSMLRGMVSDWIAADVPGQWNVEATVVDVKGPLARIRRNGQAAPDGQFYPSIAPYQPRVGDVVICGRTKGGLFIMGAINRGGATDVTTNNFAKLDEYATFEVAPSFPAQGVGAYDDRPATTAWVVDFLISEGLIS